VTLKLQSKSQAKLMCSRCLGTMHELKPRRRIRAEGSGQEELPRGPWAREPVCRGTPSRLPDSNPAKFGGGERCRGARAWRRTRLVTAWTRRPCLLLQSPRYRLDSGLWTVLAWVGPLKNPYELHLWAGTAQPLRYRMFSTGQARGPLYTETVNLIRDRLFLCHAHDRVRRGDGGGEKGGGVRSCSGGGLASTIAVAPYVKFGGG
jgi:hypothetical protein